MRQNEIQKCVCCGKGMMHAGSPSFYRVAIEHMVINVGAIRRQAGLEMMLGSPALAAVMGPDQTLAEAVGKPVTVFVCQGCGIMNSVPVAQMLEEGGS
jgi:hypothetical protein